MTRLKKGRPRNDEGKKSGLAMTIVKTGGWIAAAAAAASQ
jgi:hypothetical protein